MVGGDTGHTRWEVRKGRKGRKERKKKEKRERERENIDDNDYQL